MMVEMPVMRPYLFNPDTAVTMFIGKAATAAALHDLSIQPMTTSCDLP
jgi:hypothetical protein